MPLLDFDFVLIPAGEFIMGSKLTPGASAEPDEMPQHVLALDDFYCARYPVTNAQYNRFVIATGHRPPKFWKSPQMPIGKEEHPVVDVNFQDCLAFCNWASSVLQLSIRLPFEPEWEKAARGTEARIYPWGNRWEANRCNSSEAKLKDTSPVTRFELASASPYGVVDMVGNVSEWCFSIFSDYPYRAEDGREELQLANGQKVAWGATWGLATTMEPSRMKGNEQRVLRGGSFRETQAVCRCAHRSWAAALHVSDDTGFRVVYRK